MKKHKQIYMEQMGYCEEDIVLCEACGGVAVDIHHIEFKSQGGTNYIGNLIALCRLCHDKAHGKIKGCVLTKFQLLPMVDRRSRKDSCHEK